ncbi:MAG TPA: glutamate racemase [Bacteroidia bacterium]|nr:glutamate racemase [Bacteroidia bacterium]
MVTEKGSIGIFDSGYGGLTVFKEIIKELPEYDYIYLGDNARAPYGSRSFETVYQFTLECVKLLFQKNCPLVILACNTASARALRNIQQKDLPIIAPQNRVLGVIRPTAEVIGNFSKTKHIGIFATEGTVKSESYILEIQKFFPDVVITQEACPMWVPLIENNEHLSEGADYFVKKHIENLFDKDNKIDTVLLGCTHYPLLLPKIKQFIPEEINIITQGEIVAKSLKNYLQRHPEIDERLNKNGKKEFYTTIESEWFNEKAAIFFGENLQAKKIKEY